MSEPNGNGGLRISVSTLQFIIQLGVLLVAICGFGFSIRGSVQVQGVKMEEQQKKIDSLERKIELLRYDVGQMKIDLAGKGVLTVREPQP